MEETHKKRSKIDPVLHYSVLWWGQARSELRSRTVHHILVFVVSVIESKPRLSPRLSSARFSLWHSWDWGADYYLHRHTPRRKRKGPHFILLYVFAAAAAECVQLVLATRLNDDDKKYTNKKKTTYSTYSWPELRVFFIFFSSCSLMFGKKETCFYLNPMTIRIRH